MHDRPGTRPIPALAWILVAGAVLQLAILVAIDWYRFFGPYLIVRYEDVVRATLSVAPFLVAASVVTATPRWPAGHRWLLAGAMLFGIHGLVGGLLTGWWAWWVPLDEITPGIQVGLVTANLINQLAAGGAPLCLAVGLLRGARPEAVGGRRRTSQLGIVAAIGAAAVAGGAGYLARQIGAAAGFDGWLVALAVVGSVVMTFGAVTFALLAYAAVRAAPPRGPLPEAVIAVGAALVPLGFAITWTLQAALTIEQQSELIGLVFTFPEALTATGLLVLLAGFVLAATSPHPDASASGGDETS